MTPPVPLLRSELAAMALLLGLFVLLLLAARLFQVLAKPHPEIARKLFHTGGGLVSLLFPFLFERLWPVTALVAISAVVFLALRLVPLLNGSLGQVLGSVRRTSVGEFGFLAAIVALFWLSGRAPVLFGVPLLILAVADTFAALVGVSYGSLHFRTVDGGKKSAEGCLAFFVAAFLCVHVPLLLWTDVGRAECLIIALNVALMTTMAEAVAWHGLDNFLIPFFGLVFLRTCLPLPAAELVFHFVLLAGLSLFVYGWRKRATLAGNALFGAVVFGYVAWLLTDWQWLIAPLLLFATYRAVSFRVEQDRVKHIHFPVLLSMLMPALFWPVLYWLSPQGGDRFLIPFAAGFAANLAVIALTRHAHRRPEAGRTRLVLVNGAKGVFVVAVPSLVLAGNGSAAALLAAALAVLVATSAFTVLEPQLRSYPLGAGRWLRQAACVTVGSGVSLLPLGASG